MRIIKPYAIGALTRAFSRGSAHRLGVSPLYAFPLVLSDRPMLAEWLVWNAVRRELWSGTRFDPGLAKATPETLVTGSAHAPDAEPVEQLDVVWSLRDPEGRRLVDERLRVTGDRHWEQDGRSSRPRGFTEMPLTWDRAFGGAEDGANPIGKGEVPVDGRVPLPNVEHADHLVSRRGDRPAPAGWDVRPGYWRSLDGETINLSPAPLRVKEPFVGGETYRLEHLHPEHPVLRGQVPRIRLRAWAKRVGQALPSGMREVPLRYDTIWMLPGSTQGIGIFRGDAAIDQADASDVEAVMFAAEWVDHPKPDDHYQRVMALQLEGGELHHSDLLPDGIFDEAQAEDAKKRAGELPAVTKGPMLEAPVEAMVPLSGEKPAPSYAAGLAATLGGAAPVADSLVAASLPHGQVGSAPAAKQGAFDDAAGTGKTALKKNEKAPPKSEVRGGYDDLFTLEWSKPGEEPRPSPRVIAFRGTEALSEPYQMEIDLLVEDASGIEIDDYVGERVTLVTRAREGDVVDYVWHGLVASMEHLSQEQKGAVFRIAVVPSLWRLSQSHHSRLFTDMSVPAILEVVLQANGLSPGDDYQLALNASYAPLEHVCQYQESDLGFLSRWMEREGIYYFFRHGADADREVLVLCDQHHEHDDLRKGRVVPYRADAASDGSSDEAFHSLRGVSNMLPHEVRLTDYDHLRPDLGVAGAAPALSRGSVKVVQHRYHFLTPQEGERLAGIRAQELMARRKVFTGHGQIMHLRSGYTMQVDEHPVGAFNQEYLVTALFHHGNQSGGGDLEAKLELPFEDEYRVDVVAIPGSVPFRPERRTPWPRVYGMENAIVDGPIESPYAQIDEHGRYKVKLHFDESDLKDGKASTWIRMLQPHGGGDEGFHFPLRKGTEVLLTFLGGDPDRPVIAGVVPNAHKPSPVVEANHTFNVIQTGSLNRIEIQDEIDNQYIQQSTPPMDTWKHMGEPHGDRTHYFHKHTDGNELIDIGTDREMEVGRDQNEHVVGDVTESYDSSHTTTVGIDRTIDVGGNHTETIQGEYVQNIMSTMTQETQSDWFSTVIGNSGTLTVGTTTDTFVGLKDWNMIGGQVNTTLGAIANLTFGVTVDVTIAAKFAFSRTLAFMDDARSFHRYGGNWSSKDPGGEIKFDKAVTWQVAMFTVQ